jgi:hypothetical protein
LKELHQKAHSIQSTQEPLLSPRDVKAKDVIHKRHHGKDSLHLQIVNETQEILDIYLNYGKYEKYMLLSLIPQTCAWLPSVPHNTHLSVYTHKFDDEKYYKANGDTFTRIDKKLIPNQRWRLDSDVLLGYSDPKTHEHDLIFYPNFSDSFSMCDTCSIELIEKPAFTCIDHKRPGENPCKFLICSTCFYEFRLKKTIPFVEEDLSLVLDGERWWEEEPTKPKITTAQNPLIRLIVDEYLEQRKKENPTPEISEFPREVFNSWFGEAYPEEANWVGNDWGYGDDEVPDDPEDPGDEADLDINLMMEGAVESAPPLDDQTIELQSTTQHDGDYQLLDA